MSDLSTHLSPTGGPDIHGEGPVSQDRSFDREDTNEAINQLGVMGRSKTGDGLIAMYRQDSDPAVKRSIINALFIQQNAPAIVDIARKESDPAMKKELVSRLSVMHSKEATDYLMELLSK